MPDDFSRQQDGFEEDFRRRLRIHAVIVFDDRFHRSLHDADADDAVDDDATIQDALAELAIVGDAVN